MKLSRSIHDELSEELLAISYQFDSIVGRDEITQQTRTQIRAIQVEIISLVENLRHEILSNSENQPTFSVHIRAQISTLKNRLANINASPESEKLLKALIQILAFPLTFLSGTKLGVADSYDLTRREKQVISLLPRGLTAKMMASELFLTEATIKTHLANIYRKLGVVNRTQAIAVGLDSKLLTF